MESDRLLPAPPLSRPLLTTTTSSNNSRDTSPERRDSLRLSARKLKNRWRAEISRKPVPVIQTVFFAQTQQQATTQPRRTLDHLPPTSHNQFVSIVNNLKLAISNPSKPLLPKLNQSGSSGSYFCRIQSNDQSSIETVGIFKPKDEEPYGAMNPKWTKWAHRVFLAPLIGGFGRGCLIPNLSYLSEAAASLLDRRLQTYIVPRTEVISISSPTFFYSWLDLRKPELPVKPGSFQLFCPGFEDASIFLKKHPWPGLPLRDSENIRLKPKRRRFSLFRLCCGHRRNPDTDSEEEDDEEDDDDGSMPTHTAANEHQKEWAWNIELMEDFRIEMEKLVILDYLMRNTDRGLDNFMIKVCNVPNCANRRHRNTSTTEEGTEGSGDIDYRERPHCHVAAIDNSLAFPHHHPNGWREYAYGWLFLPASLIGQPFTQTTRDYFLPLLTSQQWWAETVHELRKLFGIDPDFNVRMFERQIAVMKGQGWNIVESLKHGEEGPIELCRRQKAIVWDEPVQVIWDENQVEESMEVEEDERIIDPRSSSAPASHSYFPRPPMKIISPAGKRPAIRRGWSSRASSTIHKIPPRPVGLAAHHLPVDGARGLDVLKQMDALEAWHTQSDIDIPDTRLDDNRHTKAHSFHFFKPKTKPKPNKNLKKSGDLDSNNGLLIAGSSRRSKSDNNIDPSVSASFLSSDNNDNTQNPSHFHPRRKSIDRNKLAGLFSIRPSLAHLRASSTAQSGPLTKNNEGGKRDAVLYHRTVDDVFSDGQEGDDELDDDEDDEEEGGEGSGMGEVSIGIIEKLEFVTVKPFFKNC
ncbi:hypothetical protein Pst134EB_023418 [Puccinia striiformis f. sp. tritici]|nr:hypothetical protein Pst134EB_023418 [Puccinia striiformis f. sp. tritici]